MAGFSWCFSCVIHDFCFPALHLFEMLCKGTKIFSALQVIKLKIDDLTFHFRSNFAINILCEWRVPKTWGRREGEWMSLTCLQPFAHRPLRGVMWISEGHYRIPWFFASESLDNRNHLRFASATGGWPFRCLLAPRPHVAEGASASFGPCLRFLRVNSLKPSDCPSNTCLSYYSKRNFEYSWSISDYSDSIEQRSRLASSNRHHEKHPM